MGRWISDMIKPSRQVQSFEVSLKVALFNSDGRLLLVQEADTRYWELPGGRIDVGEEWQSHDDVLIREIHEELGVDARVELTDRSVSFTRQRPTDGMFQFILVRRAHFRGGSIILSSEHMGLTWSDEVFAQTLLFPPQSGYQSAITHLFAARP
jgi:8-oxo-dGTP pyrophosphatase MutT (NUDIX family)